MYVLHHQMAALLGDERRAREAFAALDPNQHAHGLLISALATSGVSEERGSGRRRRRGGYVTVCSACQLAHAVLWVYCVVCVVHPLHVSRQGV